MPKIFKSVIADEELEQLLSVALTSWPLYRELNYTNLPDRILVPQFLVLDCPTCKKEQIWETPLTNLRANDSGDKRGFYKKALRLRNFGLGIASLAYMRRVIENRMNDMLDILHESAQEHGAPRELLEELGTVKGSRRFVDKIEYGAKLLPENLRPQGLPNPIGILHELVSDGLHARSEDECTDIFDKCRFVFEYVFGKLRIEQEEAKTFVKNLSELSKSRAAT